MQLTHINSLRSLQADNPHKRTIALSRVPLIWWATFLVMVCSLFAHQVGAVAMWHDVSSVAVKGNVTAASLWSEDVQVAASGDWLILQGAPPPTNEEPQLSHYAPLFGLHWQYDDTGFFPTKTLRLSILEVSHPVNESSPNDVRQRPAPSHTWHDVQLVSTNAYDVADYSVKVAVLYETGLVHVALYKDADVRNVHTPSQQHGTSSVPVAAHTFSLPADFVQKPLWLVSPNDHVTIDASPRFQPVAHRLTVGQLTASGQPIALSTIDVDETVAVRITSDEPTPGAYHIKAQTEHETISFGRIHPIESSNTIEWPANQLPLGNIHIVAEYVLHEESAASAVYPLTVGKASMAIQHDTTDAETGSTAWRFVTQTSSPLRGVNIQVRAEANALSSAVGEQANTLSWQFPSFKLGDAAPHTATLPLPPDSGPWEIEFSAVADPQIQFHVTGKKEILYMTQVRNDSPIAVTDQGSQHILVFHPDAADWNDPEAIMWSWAPKASNGFAGLTGGWGNPSGLKLRRSELWGGEWMLVVDSKGLAAIVPYPEGDSRKWAQVIKGNLHSAELLPDGNIAIAASTGGFVRVYTSSQGPNSDHYVEYKLAGAHGVLWDPALELLWALGDTKLIGFKVGDSPEQPSLNKVREHALPTFGGHDLAPVYANSDRLWITTSSRVYQYEKSTDTWHTTFIGGDLLNMSSVKGVGDTLSGRIVVSKPKAGSLHSWTTDAVHILLPAENRVRDDAAFYKVRVWEADYQ